MIFDLDKIQDQDILVYFTTTGKIENGGITFNNDQIKSITVINEQGMPLFKIDEESLKHKKIKGDLHIFNE